MLRKVAVSCVLVAACSITLWAAKFPTKKCTVPYNEDPGERLRIDQTCGLKGDAPPNSAEAKQNVFKNNLCATSGPAIITIQDIDDLQRAVDASGLVYGSRFRGKGPPDDRS